MPSNLTRRQILAASAAALIVPAPALALNENEARRLIDSALSEVNAAISASRSEAQMYQAFERIFSRYADVPTIARSALGVAARSATRAQLDAFTPAFRAYISHKYGRRFREFIGSRFEVTGARPVKSFYEVSSIAHLRGEAPFEVRWHVSDRSGRYLFFNIIVEGVNMLAAERTEIGAMLDRNRGNLDALIADLGRV
ncbi:MlaC/ttg2D family ABC transporter substrate-binding protein [Phaeovulum vinaykumarii]|uniref:Phospholipid transport system substrate-binding protein n=1 Tax=Phaeovulum vinaykumarii TaxID=407234 RepID=A0A1N7L4C7_9RHOB|nr:ABC transporter substrate-binding protein [Phaeovulum vinaykumarii]SIS68667.1 phospholipid transport system substrate-binding protein [Phaeovulum vinaykumarii]SOB99928.1 phospholipid transport system substrate-binding protein [Phaeovulum vinaykumarii]